MQVTINRDGQQYGPYPIEDAVAHLATGGLLATDWAFMEGMTDWAPLGEVVAAAQAPTPVAAPVPPAAAQPAAAQPAAAQPMAAQPMATQPAAAQPAAAQPMAAQPVAAQPMAAQPMAAQPVAAQPAAQLASPSQLSTSPALASPSQLGTGGGSSVAAKAKKTSTPKPSPDNPAKASRGDSKGLFAGNKKLIFAVCGIVISAVVIGMQLTGGDEKIDVKQVEVNETAANTAESELQKLGAQFDYDVNEQVNSVIIREKAITQAQFRTLLEFKNLQRISLVKCGIDDAALQGLKGFTKLSFLDVSGNTKVTDGCIDTLTTIKTLSTLNASETGITSVGEEKLKEKLPNCNVIIKAASAEPAKQQP